MELECGHLVVTQDLRPRTQPCGHCAGVQAATILLDDYFGPVHRQKPLGSL